MLIFHKIRFKNFKSYGNVFTEVDFQKNQLTGIVGKNGNGKSTINDAICFALYGKTITNIPKAKLVNSINGKGTLVEIEFNADGREIMVRRGIKPNVFEIYRDGKLIEEESNVRDYQELLETQILKVCMKNFMQTIVVSTTSYIPFMELTASDRRLVIENILGVGILSDMNGILKTKLQENVSVGKELDYQKNILQTKIESTKRIIETLKDTKKENEDSIKRQIEELQNTIVSHEETIAKLTEQIDKRKPVVDKYNDFLNHKRQLQLQKESVISSIKESLKMVEFLKKHDTCPVCGQNITDEHRKPYLDNADIVKKDIKQKVDSIDATLNEMIEKEEKYLTIIEQYNEYCRNISIENANISSINRQINGLYSQMSSDDVSVKLQGYVDEVYTNGQKLTEVCDSIEKNTVENGIITQCGLLLKDSGIKTAVVNQYLPIINQMINKYLADMDFFLSFELDEKFNETIKSRHRDEFTYQNLSQGEKRRLDLAIMFTWRYISQLRNSCNSSLIIIDELLDNSLDEQGVECVMKMLKAMENSNVFIISHRETIQDIGFENVIKIKKDGQFSVIE